MKDLSQFSDAELMALKPPQVAAAPKSLSDMSDAELKALQPPAAPETSKPSVLQSVRETIGAPLKPLSDIAASVVNKVKAMPSWAEQASAQVNDPGDPVQRLREGKDIPLAMGMVGPGTINARIAGVLGAPVGTGIENVARRAITPFPMAPERAALVNTLRAEGVQPTAGQATGRNALRYAESQLGDAPLAGNKATRRMEAQGEQFTRAALNRAGEDAPRATTDVVDRMFTRIGGDFDNLAARNHAVLDVQLGHDLHATQGEYNSLVPASQRAPIVGDLITDIGNIAASGNGFMDGPTYQAMRSRIDRLSRGAAGDPQLSTALRGVRNALDDAMERSIAANNPQDVGAWREARRQYRNALVIEKAATAAGEQAAQGILTPAQLRSAVVAQGRRAYGRGQGDFADLVHAGEALLKPLPQSGTAPRNFIMGIPALIAHFAAGPAAAAGVFATPGAIGRTLMSRPAQAYLSNQALQPKVPPARQALVDALMRGN